MAPNDFCSPQEFSRLSGLSLSTVRRYVHSGRLPSVQPGGPGHRVLIPRDALARAAHTPAAEAQPAPDGAPAAAAKSRPLPGPQPRWLQGRPR